MTTKDLIKSLEASRSENKVLRHGLRMALQELEVLGYSVEDLEDEWMACTGDGAMLNYRVVGKPN